jgi:hypothetical protein
MLRRQSMVKGLVICLPLLLGGCLGLPSFLAPSGGVSVTPIGTNIAREVEQTAVKQETTTSAGRDVIQTETVKEVELGPAETVTVNNQDTPMWLILVALLGWLLPTPSQMGIAIWNAILVLTSPLARLKRRSGE